MTDKTVSLPEQRQHGGFIKNNLRNYGMLLSLFAIRVSRPESGILQSLSAVYQKSPFEMIWPTAGLSITILICLALWRDRRTPAPR